MKTFFNFSLFMSLLTINAYGQDIQSVKKKMIKDLTPKAAKYSWTLRESATQVELRYIDTFFINTSINPLNNSTGIYNRLDTVFIQIRLEENWTQKRLDSIKLTQKAILDPLIERFISHYDSLNWRGVRADKDMFLYQPISYLMRWDGITKNERSQLTNLVRLPNKTIGNVGLFVESTVRCYAMIEPKEVNIKVDNAYRAFSETLGVSLYICEDIYK